MPEKPVNLWLEDLAQSSQQLGDGICVTTNAKLRSEARTDAEQLGIVPRNSEEQLINMVYPGDGYGWAYLVFNGQYGYIRSDLYQFGTCPERLSGEAFATDDQELAGINAFTGNVNIRNYNPDTGQVGRVIGTIGVAPMPDQLPIADMNNNGVAETVFSGREWIIVTAPDLSNPGQNMLAAIAMGYAVPIENGTDQVPVAGQN